MKRSLPLLLLLVTFSTVHSQTKNTFKLGKIFHEELKMNVYEKDTNAKAVVLYEHGKTFINQAKQYNLSTEYYFRIKILKKDGFDKAVVKIPYYRKEEVDKIEGVTYNLENSANIQKSYISEKDIFINKVNENWSEVSFTLPNIKVGSVIEYKYRLTTPYFQKINDWEFQSDIPKIKSEYFSSIIGSYKYNVRLIGALPLDKNEPSVKTRCMEIPGYGKINCSVINLGMKDIPAFHIEDYMTSKKNFISRVTFELASFTYANGDQRKYTEDWKSTDKRLKSSDYFGSKINKSNYFIKNLPDSIFKGTSELAIAKKIYYFIQNHYHWNSRHNTYFEVNPRKAFTSKTGSVGDINLSLFNALKAAEFDVNIALVSTRNNGVPAKLHPVITDFNYVVVVVKIDNVTYFLDATNKQLTFGLTPFKTLNGEMRVMNFKDGSYWLENNPILASLKNVNLQLTIDEDGNTDGTMRIVKSGYEAFNLREQLAKTNEEQYLENFESDAKIEINDYKISGEDRKANKIQQQIKFNLENSIDVSNNQLFINPFLHEKFTVNPFKLNERSYPVDFGYKRNYTYRGSISIPKGFKVISLPENKAFKLENGGGSFIFSIKKSESKITLFYRHKLGKTFYSSDEYFYLKEFFNQIIKVQNAVIILQKE